jgi:hypothetical protein
VLIVTKEKQIQIPEELFNDLYDLLDWLGTYTAIYNFPAEFTSLRLYALSRLQEKKDKQLAHQLYAKTKTATTREERQAAKDEYLDHLGIRQSFRH